MNRSRSIEFKKKNKQTKIKQTVIYLEYGKKRTRKKKRTIRDGDHVNITIHTNY